MPSTYSIESIDQLMISKNTKAFIKECLENNIPIDQIGFEFEKTKLSEQDQKKKKGQFYTPDHIVDYIIKYLALDHTMKIIDPSCGTGSFILPIVKKLFQGEPIESVYGIDIDHEALEVLKALIFLHKMNIYESNLIHGNTIVSNKKISSLALNLQEISQKGGFDVVIGNPPYVTLKKDVDYDSSDQDYSQLLNGQVNAATLMIAKGLSILKPNGILAFVLPKNILHVGSYSKLRDYLLKETTIIHIADLRSSFKNVRGEQIILFVQKKKPSEAHEIEFKILQNKSGDCSKASVFVKQSAFVKNNKLYVFERVEDYELIDQLTNTGSPLKKLVQDEIFRGISIPSKLQFDFADEHSQTCVPYVRGKNIQKFTLIIEKCINRDKMISLTNPKIERILNKKIIIQNIFSSESGLICAFDQRGLFTNETVTNVLIEDVTIGYYLLGLLNSKVANYYLIYACYNCSKMTMHTDKEYLGAIPVIVTSEKEQYDRIITIVRELSDKNHDIESLSKSRQELDQCFYSIYGLQQKDIQVIETGLDLFLSKKSRW